MRPCRFASRGVLAVIAMAAWMLLTVPGCSSDWDQSTPEATIKTARKLVEKNRARELGKLIYPESPEMTAFLQKLGVLLGNLQKLADQVNKSLPDEMAKLKEKATDAATSGKAADVLSQLANQGRRRGRPDFRQQEQQQEAFQSLIESLFADPYQVLREGEGHLSTAYLTDDTVSLRWDDEPILPPIGLQMRQDEKTGLWYFKLPTNIPVLSQYLPRSKKEWKIAEYGVVVLNNTLVDLRKDLAAGQIGSLDRLSRAAAEKTFPPIIMIFAAYSKALEDRKKAPEPPATKEVVPAPK